MDTITVLSLVSSIASLVLAILAIALSIVFFRMSSELSTSTTEAAKGIGASVERLEKLFDKLYADTFSMMRDTVSDMRKHIWPEDAGDADKVAEEAERRAERKVNELKSQVDSELSSILARQNMADGRLEAVHGEMRTLIEKAIADSRRADAEAHEETISREVRRTVITLRRLGRAVTADAIVESLAPRFASHQIVNELRAMIKNGALKVDNDILMPDSVIRLP